MGRRDEEGTWGRRGVIVRLEGRADGGLDEVWILSLDHGNTGREELEMGINGRVRQKNQSRHQEITDSCL